MAENSSVGISERPTAVDLHAVSAGAATAALAARGCELLSRDDPELAELLDLELGRQHATLSMVAAASGADPSVLAAAGSVFGNLTTEGYPGARYHAGCEVADRVELLAARRAARVFGARYANVQPHSGSSANLAVMTALLSPGDTLMGMELASGGHLTHGSPASMISRYCTVVSYSVDSHGLLDYDEIEALARRHRPRLIVCGASAYPRAIDFARFRRIADEVDAVLLADISHIAGLVAAGLHASPIDLAHVTTTSTYKQLYGPRGGLVLLGRNADEPAPTGRGSWRSLIQRAIFPSFQGTPDLASIAAKARAMELAGSTPFRALAEQVLATAGALSDALLARDFELVTGGTDTHMVLLDLRSRGITGAAAEQALESCGIMVNRNRVPNDPTPARVTSGLRLGTNPLALRRMPPVVMEGCAAAVELVLGGIRETRTGDYWLDPDVRTRVRRSVSTLCARYPLPDYPLTSYRPPDY